VQGLPPAVDEEVLAALLDELGDPGPELRTALLSSYGDSSSAVIELRTAALTDEAETVRAIAHTLRSSSAWLGALPLAELLSETEAAARGGGGDLPALSQRISAEHGRVMTALTRLLAGPDAPAG